VKLVQAYVKHGLPIPVGFLKKPNSIGFIGFWG